MSAVEWVVVGGAVAPWRRLGLVVADPDPDRGDDEATWRIPLFGTGIELTGDDTTAGLTGWVWSGIDDQVTDLDGVPTRVERAGPPLYASHPLGAARIDHVVVSTDSLARTCGIIADRMGSPLKRVRETGEMRQGFHRVGGLIIEVVERLGQAEGPATLWGLALSVDDLDAACSQLGDDVVGAPRDAVQSGRRIATVRPEAGLGVPLALMSD